MRALALAAAAAAALALAAPAVADDAVLAGTVVTWSVRLGLDGRTLEKASGDSRAAIIRASEHLRANAIRARHALLGLRPSTAAGTRMKRLALGAFHDFALAGRELAAATRAQVRGRDAVARQKSRVGQRLAATGAEKLKAAATVIEQLIP